jgi:hypothetical protein
MCKAIRARTERYHLSQAVQFAVFHLSYFHFDSVSPMPMSIIVPPYVHKQISIEENELENPEMILVALTPTHKYRNAGLIELVLNIRYARTHSMWNPRQPDVRLQQAGQTAPRNFRFT